MDYHPTRQWVSGSPNVVKADKMQIRGTKCSAVTGGYFTGLTDVKNNSTTCGELVKKSRF
jgi:hypothetical protein